MLETIITLINILLIIFCGSLACLHGIRCYQEYQDNLEDDTNN